MNSSRWILVVGLAVLLVLGFWIWRRADVAEPIDLISQFDAAEKRSTMPLENAFKLQEVSIEGRTMRCIFMHPTSRLIWNVTVPENAWLRTWVALRPEAWTREGDGVLFRIGVSDGNRYDELLNQHVDPFSVSGDRRWIPVTLDLSAYAGQEVEVIFNTNASLPRRRANFNWDHALWGAPEVYVSP